jgi:ribonuclease P protein subunit RPR2
MNYLHLMINQIIISVNMLLIKIMNNLKKIAAERIQILFSHAINQMHEKPRLAQQYSEIARKIAMRSRLHLPKEYRRLLCKKCKAFFIPGLNYRVRIQPRRETHVVITCISCGYIERIPVTKPK